MVGVSSPTIDDPVTRTRDWRREVRTQHTSCANQTQDGRAWPNFEERGGVDRPPATVKSPPFAHNAPKGAGGTEDDAAGIRAARTVEKFRRYVFVRISMNWGRIELKFRAI